MNTNPPLPRLLEFERNPPLSHCRLFGTRDYLMGPYNAGPYLTPALITPVSNCAEYKNVFISAVNGNIIRQKIS